MTALAQRVLAADVERERPVLALTRLLDDLGGLLRTIEPITYTARPMPGVSGSVGEHVRHILDHVAAFVAARPHGVMTYDRRERGTAVEADPAAAVRAIVRLTLALEDAADADLDVSVAVQTLLVRDEDPVICWSTLKRELAFVIAHTVHHQALVAVLLAMFGDHVPEGFGFAASTPRIGHA